MIRLFLSSVLTLRQEYFEILVLVIVSSAYYWFDFELGSVNSVMTSHWELWEVTSHVNSAASTGRISEKKEL